MSTDVNSIKWQFDAVLIFLMRRFFRIVNDFAWLCIFFEGGKNWKTCCSPATATESHDAQWLALRPSAANHTTIAISMSFLFERCFVKYWSIEKDMPWISLNLHGTAYFFWPCEEAGMLEVVYCYQHRPSSKRHMDSLSGILFACWCGMLFADGCRMLQNNQSELGIVRLIHVIMLFNQIFTHR